MEAMWSDHGAYVVAPWRRCDASLGRPTPACDTESRVGRTVTLGWHTRKRLEQGSLIRGV